MVGYIFRVLLIIGCSQINGRIIGPTNFPSNTVQVFVIHIQVLRDDQVDRFFDGRPLRFYLPGALIPFYIRDIITFTYINALNIISRIVINICIFDGLMLLIKFDIEIDIDIDHLPLEFGHRPPLIIQSLDEIIHLFIAVDARGARVK